MDNFQAFCVCLYGDDEFICQISTEDLFFVYNLKVICFYVYEFKKLPDSQDNVHNTVPVRIYFLSK